MLTMIAGICAAAVFSRNNLHEMKDIAIYCAGGFGREVCCLIRKINEVKPTWNFIGFFDDVKEKGEIVSHYGKVLGGIDDVNSWDKELNVVIAIGNGHQMKAITSRITNPLVFFPNIIHPEVIFADKDSLVMGKGNIIQRASAFSCDVTIGDFNAFNGGTTLGHDVVMDSYNTLMPGVRISGGTTMGERNFFGVGSIVLQGLRIGEGVSLGAGSVLMKKPKDGMLYMGNPAKKMEF